VSKPLESLRRVPGVGALAEQKMGGFLVLSGLVGVGVGVATAGLVWSLDGVSHLIDRFFGEGEGLWIFLTVPIGLLTAWWVARAAAPEVAGDGVPEAVAALAVHGGRMRARVVPLKTLATAVTLGSGGSAGREGPIVQIGAAMGSWVSTRFGLGEDQVRSLVAAGAGAAIGASFNAPIAGMLFALEVILVSFAPRHISAIVIASVTAAVTSRELVGPELSIGAGAYEMGSFSELWLYGLLALVIVGFGYIFIRLLDWGETAGSRIRGPLRPLGFGLAVATLIFVEPNLFGTGQEVTNSLLLQEFTGTGDEAWWLLGLLAAGKALATSLTISSGASGGAFMPSLFMGAVVGTGFARLVEPVWTGSSELMPGAFAVVGMAAMFAVVARAPLTSILIVFEVTGARDYQLILPLMLAATLGTFLAERFLPDSVYSLALRRRGILLPRTGDVDLLDTVTVGDVMVSDPFVAGPDLSLADVEALLQAHRSHGAPVVDDGALVGIITISDLGRTLERLEDATVGEVMTQRPVTVTPATPVSQALERMAALGVGRLPVVGENDPTSLVGMFRREEAVRAYHEALGSSTDAELTRLRLAQRTDPGAGYYQFRIPPGSIADDRRVRDVAWPEGTTLVSIRRHRQVMVPSGDSVLLAGDVVTAFGTPGSLQRVIERLNAGADEPTAEIELSDLDADDDSSKSESNRAVPGPGIDSVE
jgi:CIC family chloride channel protein